MAWQYSIDENKIFHLEVSGEFTAQEILESTLLAVKMQKEQRILRFFSDQTDIVITAPLSEVYNLASQAYTELGADPLVRFAIIPPKDEISGKIIEVFTLTSQHRDRMIQSFESKEQAFDWLMGNEEEQTMMDKLRFWKKS